MNKKLLFLLLAFSAPILSIKSYAQENLYVSERQLVIEQATDRIKKLYINVEKATVIISTWKEPSIKAEVRFISRHTQERITLQELAFLDLTSGAQGSTYYMRTVVKLPRRQALPESALTFNIRLYIPEDMEIELISKLGKISIDGGDMPVSIQLHLSQLDIINATLKGSIQQNFGSLLLKESIFNGKIDLKQTNARFEHVGGDLSLSGESGKWTFHSLTDIKSLLINSKRAEISCITAANTPLNMMLNGARVQLHPDLPIAMAKTGNKQYRVGSKEVHTNIQMNNTDGLIKINPK